jgi:two-component system, NarL family, nitrate/nitrite response regulator NarL
MGQKNSSWSSFPSDKRVRVIVADPYPVIVHGVRKMVEDDPRFQVVAEASTMPSFQKKVNAGGLEVALVDWSMASRDLTATVELLRSDLHMTSIVFLTVSENSEQKREMLRLGARAFVSKWSSAHNLQKAVLKASTGAPLVERSAVEAGLAAGHSTPAITDAEQRMKQLTRRERQMIPLVCRGLKNKEIALQLGISESTVWHHLTAVFKKLGVEDRLGLATFIYGQRMVLPETQPLRPPTLEYPAAIDWTGDRQRDRSLGVEPGEAAGI